MLSTGRYERRSSRTRRARPRNRRWFNILVLIALLVSVVLLALALLRREADNPAGTGELTGARIATVAVLNVGQALSAGVATDDGHGLVYDFGLTRDDADQVIARFLSDHDIDRLDYAILSHPHQDHVGGLPALAESIEIDTYLDPVIETTNQTYLQSLEIIEDQGISTGAARQGDSYTLGADVEFEILWPTDDLLEDSSGAPLINDNSTVVKLDAGDVTVLLTGDIEEAAEQQLVETYGDELDVDVLQVAHHGSSTSTRQSFLSAADPEVAIIPVGADNQYGHPHTETVQILREHNVEVYRTDLDGTVTIETDGSLYEIHTVGSESW